MKFNIILLLLALSVRAVAQEPVPDSSFGINSAFSNHTGYNCAIKEILPPEEGYPVAAGAALVSPGYYVAINMTRFTQDGEIDSSFGENGTALRHFGFSTIPGDFTTQPDGKIICVGSQKSSISSQAMPLVCRFTVDGNVDSSFNSTGFSWTQFPTYTKGSFYSVDVMDDGRIICIGSLVGTTKAIVVMRFLSNGIIDSTYGVNGRTIYPNGQLKDTETYGYLTTDGKVVAISAIENDFFSDHFFAIGFDSTGAIDQGFGDAGIFIDEENALDIAQKEMVTMMTSDGKITAAAFIHGEEFYIDIIQLNFDGTLNLAFGASNGHAILDEYPFASLKNIFEISNGNILLAGKYAIGDGVGCSVLMDSEGEVVPEFGNGNGWFELFIDPEPGYSFDAFLELSPCIWLVGCERGEMQVNLFRSVGDLPVISQAGPLLSAFGYGDFQWYLDGQPIGQATDNNYHIEANGNYTVENTDATGCNRISEVFPVFTVDNQNLEHIEVTLSPNPFDNLISITITGSQKAALYIYDAFGRQISYFSINNEIESIDASSLSSGVYFYTIIIGKEYISGKLIKFSVIE